MELNRGTRVVVTNRAIRLNGRTGTVKGWAKSRMVLVQLDGEDWLTPFFANELASIYTLSRA